ncbi:hypothetical protein DBV15_06948 [Temnothorax longispinosus]|uniref:Uncharacterized protein n=1 Tax=Temnothorax longispinosus TaxID=300112 RepID=A0A4S2KWM7_9HYME|nr:hypothetical protein DBV15_06948 [Temnothorax longispinosus]
MASNRSPYETRRPNTCCRCWFTSRNKPVLCTGCTCFISGRPCTEKCRCDPNKCINCEKKSDHTKVKEQLLFVSNQKNEREEDIIDQMLNQISQNNERIKELEEKMKNNDSRVVTITSSVHFHK